jgi:hypothetical protein
VRFEEEIAELNGRRASVLLPILAVGHVVHVALFRASGAGAQRWRDGIALTHAVTLAVCVPLAIVAMRGRLTKKHAPWLGAVVSLAYMLHAAAIVSVDQIEVTSVTPFIGYAMGVATVMTLAPRVSIPIYGGGLAAFAAGIVTMQHDKAARLSILPNGVSIVLLGAAFSWILFAAKKRDFAQRVTIEEQRKELERLNASLEHRLEEKVAEIVERADEVERLNAHLQAQVRTRGAELGAALAKLAEQRGLRIDLGVGSVIEDRFEIVRPLGAGGMGVVYEGIDKTTNERVAIKVIQAGSAQQLDALQRFVREASSVATIRHPAVVRMLHVGITSDGLLFQVQELVEGETLARARGASKWSAADVARLGSVLAEALAAAHVASVVHRDVKPGNVILTTAPPGLKLLDFGIAKLEDGGATSTSGTRTGTALGTPAFMAPEQIDGARDVSDRADVYAAAVTMFLLLTARYPFEGSSAQEIMLGHQVIEAPDARKIEPSVPDAIAVLLKSCLAKDPAARPSAKSLMHELARIADDLGAAPLESIVQRLEHEAAHQDRVATVAE